MKTLKNAFSIDFYFKIVFKGFGFKSINCRKPLKKYLGGKMYLKSGETQSYKSLNIVSIV